MILFLSVFALSSSVFAQIHEIPDSAVTTGLGKIFQVTSSEFLNVTVECSDSVYAYVQSVPQQVMINVAKPIPELQSTTLTVKNLISETTYNITKNGSTDLIITDKSGTYICDIDLSLPQKILITQNN
jgi:hypothetical protein